MLSTGTGYRFWQQRSHGRAGPSAVKVLPIEQRRAPWLRDASIVARFLLTSARYLGAQAPLPAPPDSLDDVAGDRPAADRPARTEMLAAWAQDDFEDTQPGWYGTT